MESRGRLKGISRDWQTGKFLVTFEVDADISGQIESMTDRELRITAKRWREKRSLDANAYHWVLIGKLAEALRVSKSFMHNMMLRKYGQDEVIGGKLVYVVLPDTPDGERIAEEADTYHIRPTSEVKFDREGIPFRTYIMMRGSRTYDSAEMARLIDGVVQECKEAGIETETPDEIERMKQVYDMRRMERNTRI